MWKLLLWITVVGTILLTLAIVLLSPKVEATHGTSNISGVNDEHFAWNDVVGWINMHDTDTVVVSSTKILGYASSSVGDISFDCATTRNGNICGQSNYSVVNEPSSATSTDPNCNSGGPSGKLSGYAWNDVVGWISMSCTNENPTCSQSSSTYYRVSVDPVTGDFNGWGWNDIAGWISFNCANHGGCGASNYKVKTTWQPTAPVIACLDSATFDTQTLAGAQLNSIIWKGSKPGDSCVDFRIAGSNASSGPWDYTAFKGPDGTSNSHYGAECPTIGQGCVLPGRSICVDPNQVTNFRYLRYKVRLQSTSNQNNTPRVDDIILNWSR
ncbi:hypothetical protein HY967_01185 [Candidatus Jorgensenbacteria bacterium]|nr:hypothetical protein [Candidatus Jorgensenbacteria bacterium]